MQQRQLRLGDILDDYCTRERRLTNHAIVAMVGDVVKQTRCTTCDTEHEYKHAKVPRQRRKADTPAALYAQVAANAPKRVTASPPSSTISDEHDDIEVGQGAADAGAIDARDTDPSSGGRAERSADAAPLAMAPRNDAEDVDDLDHAGENGDDDRGNRDDEEDEGPVHRPLIRASLPREGQPPPARPIPEFTIRQPGGRPNRFRPRHQRGGQPFHTDRSNGNGFGGQRNAGPRHGSGRPPQGAVPSRQARRHGPGRKRSK
jgi:hypothetical protein